VNGNKIIKEEMTLEEKLEAIDRLMHSAQESPEDFNKRNGRPLNAPVDPSDLTMCEGCQ